MTADDEIHDHQVRCQPYLLELHMLGRVEAGLVPTAAEVGRTTGAIIAEVGAASRAALAAAGDGRPYPGAGPFLQFRLNRLTAAAEEAIARSQDGDFAALRRVLHRFDALTSAIWTVQDAVRGPAGPAGARAASKGACRQDSDVLAMHRRVTRIICAAVAGALISLGLAGAASAAGPAQAAGVPAGFQPMSAVWAARTGIRYAGRGWRPPPTAVRTGTSPAHLMFFSSMARATC